MSDDQEELDELVSLVYDHTRLIEANELLRKVTYKGTDETEHRTALRAVCQLTNQVYARIQAVRYPDDENENE